MPSAPPPLRRRIFPVAALSGVLMLTLTSCPEKITVPVSTVCTLSEADWQAIEAPAHSQARVWDELALHAIRNVLPQPTAHARTLFHLSAAMYDVWASYDGAAQGVFSHEKHSGSPAQLDEALNYAAHRVLKARYGTLVPGLATCFDTHLKHLGLDSANSDVTGDSAAAIGNRTGQAVLSAAANDGANEAGNYADTSGYTFLNAPLQPEFPGTTLNAPDHWQRLLLQTPFTQNSIPQSGPQTFMGAHWGSVQPFAMHRSGAFYHDTGPAPSVSNPLMRTRWIPDSLRRQAELDPASAVMLDTSPGAIGNNPLGSDAGSGHPLNPATGQPYAPNVVRQADYGRVLAEYWADGPRAETPPGHWNVIANQVADDPAFVRRMQGTGQPLGALEWDVKLYLALNGALHDAAISAWEIKRQTDTGRPISLIRYLAAQSAAGGAGLIPEAGLIEERGGTLQVRGWHPGTGVVWEDPLTWVPYQLSNFVSPAFPAFVSGHSTFSRAAAEVLTTLTGSAFFPGGLHEFVAPPSYLKTDRPSNTAEVRLQWATYADAADQAGQSRIWGGIHLEPDDLTGRRIGHLVGLDAVNLALRYFAGNAP
ncbi:vanadium-dependent haloperoxidase [Deinococcus ruber]|uniref:DUF6851 domain-containing protein n=1 Tax=Deinococcus ruber TaxID=1848197 RepID=A0A918CC14_9DEIO|nr:vanadium-dependent haloperoxidase [Deinococcus ruber]GGR14785.1 hypothetical protein GCM10008957_29530 [Deinococcus ruber]